MEDLKEKLSHSNSLHFLIDGSAGQYKNRKTLHDVRLIQYDYGMDAKWNVFATLHGKSPFDGI